MFITPSVVSGNDVIKCSSLRSLLFTFSRELILKILGSQCMELKTKWQSNVRQTNSLAKTKAV